MPAPRRFLPLADAFGFGAGFFPAAGFAGAVLPPAFAAGLAFSPIRVRLPSSLLTVCPVLYQINDKSTTQMINLQESPV